MLRLFLFIALLPIQFVCSNECLDSFAYYFKSLQKEESQLFAGEQSLYQKLLFVQKTHDILLDFLMTADEEDFYDFLKLSKPYIDAMSRMNDEIFFQIYQDRFCDRRLASLNGIPVFIYYNAFSRKMPLSDEERTFLYEEEVQRHQNVALQPKQKLTKSTLKKLISGQTYNFVLNLENKAYISYNQRYKLKNEASKTILNSPNHTILAGNAPILSAGVINYYQVGKKKLYILSCSSGHFHPLPDSLIHIKNYLMALGIPEEAIICLSLSYEKMEAYVQKNAPPNS